eukprot:COSAG05_NODE_3626_length_1949_cov_1.225946_3_plen_60_part_01
MRALPEGSVAASYCGCVRITGITVAAVLHQPRYEMFCLFHDVLLLGKGGFTVYLGPATKA